MGRPVHQVGVAWHDGTVTRTRTPALLLAGGGLLALLVLTGPGPYAVTMVEAAPPPDLDNTAPPSLALLALAATQIGAALLLRRVAEPWLARPRAWLAVVAVNGSAFTLYLWHMVPVVLAGAALVTTGLFPQPALGSAAWWWLRVPWLAVLAALLVAVVAVTGRWERRTAASPEAHPPPLLVAAGILACLAGLAGLGLGGTDGVLPPVVGVPVGELLLVAAGFGLLTRAGRRSPPARGSRTERRSRLDRSARTRARRPHPRGTRTA